MCTGSTPAHNRPYFASLLRLGFQYTDRELFHASLTTAQRSPMVVQSGGFEQTVFHGMTDRPLVSMSPCLEQVAEPRSGDTSPGLHCQRRVGVVFVPSESTMLPDPILKHPLVLWVWPSWKFHSARRTGVTCSLVPKPLRLNRFHGLV